MIAVNDVDRSYTPAWERDTQVTALSLFNYQSVVAATFEWLMTIKYDGA